jgi:hypothetical protein
MRFSPEVFRDLANKTLGKKVAYRPRITRCERERWAAFFGTTSVVASHIWGLIETSVVGAQPKHLLWALVFLKVYAPSEKVHCRLVGNPDEKTFRKYSWMIIKAIQSLKSQIVRTPDNM